MDAAAAAPTLPRWLSSFHQRRRKLLLWAALHAFDVISDTFLLVSFLRQGQHAKFLVALAILLVTRVATTSYLVGGSLSAWLAAPARTLIVFFDLYPLVETARLLRRPASPADALDALSPAFAHPSVLFLEAVLESLPQTLMQATLAASALITAAPAAAAAAAAAATAAATAAAAASTTAAASATRAATSAAAAEAGADADWLAWLSSYAPVAPSAAASLAVSLFFSLVMIALTLSDLETADARHRTVVDASRLRAGLANARTAALTVFRAVEGTARALTLGLFFGVASALAPDLHAPFLAVDGRFYGQAAWTVSLAACLALCVCAVLAVNAGALHFWLRDPAAAAAAVAARADPRTRLSGVLRPWMYAVYLLLYWEKRVATVSAGGRLAVASVVSVTRYYWFRAGETLVLLAATRALIPHAARAVAGAVTSAGITAAAAVPNVVTLPPLNIYLVLSPLAALRAAASAGTAALVQDPPAAAAAAVNAAATTARSLASAVSAAFEIAFAAVFSSPTTAGAEAGAGAAAASAMYLLWLVAVAASAATLLPVPCLLDTFQWRAPRALAARAPGSAADATEVAIVAAAAAAVAGREKAPKQPLIPLGLPTPLRHMISVVAPDAVRAARTKAAARPPAVAAAAAVVVNARVKPFELPSRYGASNGPSEERVDTRLDVERRRQRSRSTAVFRGSDSDAHDGGDDDGGGGGGGSSNGGSGKSAWELPFAPLPAAPTPLRPAASPFHACAPTTRREQTGPRRAVRARTAGASARAQASTGRRRRASALDEEVEEEVEEAEDVVEELSSEAEAAGYASYGAYGGARVDGPAHADGGFVDSDIEEGSLYSVAGPAPKAGRSRLTATGGGRSRRVSTAAAATTAALTTAAPASGTTADSVHVRGGASSRPQSRPQSRLQSRSQSRAPAAVRIGVRTGIPAAPAAVAVAVLTGAVGSSQRRRSTRLSGVAAAGLGAGAGPAAASIVAAGGLATPPPPARRASAAHSLWLGPDISSPRGAKVKW
jgi:uncharacterized membrane protein YgcG